MEYLAGMLLHSGLMFAERITLLLGLVGDELGEVGGRARYRRDRRQ